MVVPRDCYWRNRGWFSEGVNSAWANFSSGVRSAELERMRRSLHYDDWQADSNRVVTGIEVFFSSWPDSALLGKHHHHCIRVRLAKPKRLSRSPGADRPHMTRSEDHSHVMLICLGGSGPEISPHD